MCVAAAADCNSSYFTCNNSAVLIGTEQLVSRLCVRAVATARGGAGGRRSPVVELTRRRASKSSQASFRGFVVAAAVAVVIVAAAAAVVVVVAQRLPVGSVCAGVVLAPCAMTG